MQAVPFQGNLWTVTVHNGTAGPITDLVVDVYAIDDAGNRVAVPCTPAKGQAPMNEFVREVVGQTMQGTLGAVADRAAAQQGFGFMPGIPPQALEFLRGGAIPGLNEVVTQRIKDVLHAQMRDSFPALLTAGTGETVLYGTGEGLSIQADIRFADEDGTYWVRPFGRPPEPAE